MSAADEQVDVLRAIAAWEPAAYVFGGVAEDALLHGRMSRPHEDIDLLVLRDDLDLRLQQAAALGFDDVHLRMAAGRDRPLVLGCFRGDLNLEFGVFERDEMGRVYWEKPTPTGTARLYLPPDAFLHPPSTLQGAPVRTVSPLALYHIREGVRDLFGGMRPKDVAAQTALRQRFLRGAPQRDLVPRVVAEAPRR